MTKTSASEGKLGELHNLLAENLMRRLEDGEEVWDSKSQQFVHITGGTTATLSVIRQFLNDNEITCVADDTNQIGSLKEKLRERTRQHREGAKVLNLSDHVPKVSEG